MVKQLKHIIRHLFNLVVEQITHTYLYIKQYLPKRWFVMNSLTMTKC